MGKNLPHLLAIHPWALTAFQIPLPEDMQLFSTAPEISVAAVDQSETCAQLVPSLGLVSVRAGYFGRPRN